VQQVKKGQRGPVKARVHATSQTNVPHIYTYYIPKGELSRIGKEGPGLVSGDLLKEEVFRITVEAAESR
jgi:hypothetical protein